MKKTHKKRTSDSDVHAIINSLNYLSREASECGSSELSFLIKAILEIFPQIRQEDLLDKNTDVYKAVNFIIQYKALTPDVQQQVLSLTQSTNDN